MGRTETPVDSRTPDKCGSRKLQRATRTAKNILLTIGPCLKSKVAITYVTMYKWCVMVNMVHQTDRVDHSPQSSPPQLALVPLSFLYIPLFLPPSNRVRATSSSFSLFTCDPSTCLLLSFVSLGFISSIDRHASL